MDEQADREKMAYEYRIESTPRYASGDRDITEDWELVDVLPKNRDWGLLYILVFRRPVNLTPSSKAKK